MPRKPQGRASRGSQHWLQVLVNERSELLNQQVREVLGRLPSIGIEWLSPLRTDDYAEYQDQAFIDRLDVRLERRPLRAFWPRRGPVWDGLGVTGEGEALLVEAKAHIPEAVSNPSAARAASLEVIQSSLAATKRGVGCRSKVDWAGSFYQYTNRLAHLHLLRDLNGVPARLLFISFLNDRRMAGPSTVGEWEGAYRIVHSVLGLPRTLPYVHHLYFDVRDL